MISPAANVITPAGGDSPVIGHSNSAPNPSTNPVILMICGQLALRSRALVHKS